MHSQLYGTSLYQISKVCPMMHDSCHMLNIDTKTPVNHVVPVINFGVCGYWVFSFSQWIPLLSV